MRMATLFSGATLILIASVAASDADVLRKPEIGAENSVGPGEVIYAETLVRTGERTSEVVVLLQEATPVAKGPALPPGSELVFVIPQVDSPMQFAGAVPGVRAACVASAFQPGALGGAKKFLCFQDINKDNRFDRAIIKGYKPSPGFTSVEYEVRTKVEQDLSNRNTFKGELLYQGASGGVLRMAYREYTDDMARPAFSQDATYDLNQQGETEVRFKGALIRVLSAGNSEIRYIIATPFKW